LRSDNAQTVQAANAQLQIQSLAKQEVVTQAEAQKETAKLHAKLLGDPEVQPISLETIFPVMTNFRMAQKATDEAYDINDPIIINEEAMRELQQLQSNLTTNAPELMVHAVIDNLQSNHLQIAARYIKELEASVLNTFGDMQDQERATDAYSTAAINDLLCTRDALVREYNNKAKKNDLATYRASANFANNITTIATNLNATDASYFTKLAERKLDLGFFKGRPGDTRQLMRLAFRPVATLSELLSERKTPHLRNATSWDSAMDFYYTQASEPKVLRAWKDYDAANDDEDPGSGTGGGNGRPTVVVTNGPDPKVLIPRTPPGGFTEKQAKAIVDQLIALNNLTQSQHAAAVSNAKELHEDMKRQMAATNQALLAYRPAPQVQIVPQADPTTAVMLQNLNQTLQIAQNKLANQEQLTTQQAMQLAQLQQAAQQAHNDLSQRLTTEGAAAAQRALTEANARAQQLLDTTTAGFKVELEKQSSYIQQMTDELNRQRQAVKDSENALGLLSQNGARETEQAKADAKKLREQLEQLQRNLDEKQKEMNEMSTKRAQDQAKRDKLAAARDKVNRERAASQDARLKLQQQDLDSSRAMQSALEKQYADLRRQLQEASTSVNPPNAEEQRQLEEQANSVGLKLQAVMDKTKGDELLAREGQFLEDQYAASVYNKKKDYEAEPMPIDDGDIDMNSRTAEQPTPSTSKQPVEDKPKKPARIVRERHTPSTSKQPVEDKKAKIARERPTETFAESYAEDRGPSGLERSAAEERYYLSSQAKRRREVPEDFKSFSDESDPSAKPLSGFNKAAYEQLVAKAEAEAARSFAIGKRKKRADRLELNANLRNGILARSAASTRYWFNTNAMVAERGRNAVANIRLLEKRRSALEAAFEEFRRSGQVAPTGNNNKNSQITPMDYATAENAGRELATIANLEPSRTIVLQIEQAAESMDPVQNPPILPQTGFEIKYGPPASPETLARIGRERKAKEVADTLAVHAAVAERAKLPFGAPGNKVVWD